MVSGPVIAGLVVGVESPGGGDALAGLCALVRPPVGPSLAGAGSRSSLPPTVSPPSLPLPSSFVSSAPPAPSGPSSFPLDT